MGFSFFGKKSSATNRGQEAEELAANYLKKQGARILAQNYRCRFGEIDLICALGELLVFVEVRLRSHRKFASGAESVDGRKQQRLITTANHYLQQAYGDAPPACRFDVVALSGASNNQSHCDLEWLQDAFRPEW